MSLGSNSQLALELEEIDRLVHHSMQEPTTHVSHNKTHSLHFVGLDF